jgi:hypothetical protein
VSSFFAYLNLPTKVCVVIAAIYLFTQLVGELLEFKGKIVPEFFKIRKYFQRKKQEKEETNKTLQEVKALLADVNEHYNSDNIAKRDAWMQWVNARAKVYDASVSELTSMKETLSSNNELTLDLYIDIHRNRIIDFASKISNENIPVSKEEFNRIFKTYNKYEAILKKHNMTNGEVNIAMRIIEDSYAAHMKNHSFIEDIRGY